MSDFNGDALYLRIDDYLRIGRFDLAQELLKRLRPKDIPRKEKARFTHLYRRCGMNYKGLRVLQAIIRPEALNDKPATEEEVIAYAGCLTNVGSYKESLELLSPLKERLGGEVLLFRAFAQIAQWKYGTAAQLLKRYLKGQSINDYTYWVGLTNYCASMIAEDRGEEIVDDLHALIQESQLKNWHLLNGNAQMLLAQYYIQISSFNKAEQVLYQPEEKLNRMKLYGGLIKKWQTILMLKSKGSEAAIENAKLYRLSAEKNNFWEGVRDIDYYLSIAEKNPYRFLRVYYGTPYESYRRRIKKDLPFSFKPDTKILIENEPLSDCEIVDLDNHPRLKNDLFLRALILDLYLPVREGQLHSLLFPKEYYNPFSSPHRVQQALLRFRKKIENSQLSLKIDVKNRSYRLNFDKSLMLPRKLMTEKRNSKEPLWLGLLEYSESNTLTIKQLAHMTNKSERTCQRLMHSAVESGYFIKQGKGKSSVYQLARNRK